MFSCFSSLPHPILLSQQTSEVKLGREVVVAPKTSKFECQTRIQSQISPAPYCLRGSMLSREHALMSEKQDCIIKQEGEKDMKSNAGKQRSIFEIPGTIRIHDVHQLMKHRITLSVCTCVWLHMCMYAHTRYACFLPLYLISTGLCLLETKVLEEGTYYSNGFHKVRSSPKGGRQWLFLTYGRGRSLENPLVLFISPIGLLYAS